MEGEIIRNIHFDKKRELKTSNVAREIGDLKVERQEKDKNTEELIDTTEKIEAKKVREYLRKDVVDSGDSLTKLEKKLKEDHGIKNNQIAKRKKIIELFKSIFTSRTADDYKKMTDDKIKKSRVI